MPALAADTCQDRATAEIVGDLVDALLADELVTIAPAPGGTGGAERWVEVPVGEGRWLGFRARSAAYPRRWRFGRGPVVVRDGDGRVSGPLDPAEVVRALARPSWAALDLVALDLAQAPAAVRRAEAAAPSVVAAVAARGLDLLAGEQLAALADRPFHPLGRHKRGWDDADAARWGPHAPQPFGLAWWGVPRTLLATGRPGPDAGAGPSAATGRPGPEAGAGPSAPAGARRDPGAGPEVGAGPSAAAEPADVLGPEDRERLAAALRRAGLSERDHVALPVHPWQARRLAGSARAAGIVPLAGELGAFRATASLRTVVPVGRPEVHLKLPMAVAALGAGRQLPVRYLRNGDRAQALLAAVARHPALAGRVHVCDESAWWTTPDDGELGAQLRRYPAAVAHGGDVSLVPLAALGVTVGGHAPALAALGRDAHGTLGDLTAVLVRLAVVALAHGIMPELHGQNVVVALRRADRSVAGLVLRDHDAARIHPPWLQDAGLPDPGYVVDGRTPNTLVADSPEALFGWFQALGIHLGLYPIVRALAGDAGETGEAAGWRVVAAAATAALAGLEADQETPDAQAGQVGQVDRAVEVARHRLLHAGSWPVKLVLGPLLERGGSCGTSMPSAIGSVDNPLLGCVR